MGAWGVLPFENDAALDWVDELEGEGASAIDDALARASESYDTDADDAAAIVAASATLAAARSGYKRPVPDEVSAWIASHADVVEKAAIDRARVALDAVMASELATLWRESGEFAAWTETIEEIRLALASA